jgi:hypothetical protein
VNSDNTTARAVVVLSDVENAAKVWRRAFGPMVRIEPVGTRLVAVHIRPGYWRRRRRERS